MNLRAAIRESAIKVFANPNRFAEPVTYYLGGHLYKPLQFMADVDRGVPDVSGPD